MVKKTLLLLIFLISCTGSETVIEEPKSLNSEEVLNVIFESYKNFSDNPEKAVISLKNDRETDYKVYIAVQNELVAAYNVLRNREFKRLNPNLGLDFVQADKIYNDPRTSIVEKERLKPLLSEVKLLFPQKLSEAESSSKSS